MTNPLDVMTEYLTRRWTDQPGLGDGLGTALETLRLTDCIARECGVHPRSVHAWVVGEHGDSCVFLLDSAVIGTLPLVEFAAQRGIDLSPSGSPPSSERCATRPIRCATSRVPRRKASDSPVSGLVHAARARSGRAAFRCRARVTDDVCASLPCVLGPDGPSAPLLPQMTDTEREAWEHSIEVLAAANKPLPI